MFTTPAFIWLKNTKNSNIMKYYYNKKYLFIGIYYYCQYVIEHIIIIIIKLSSKSKCIFIFFKIGESFLVINR